MNNNKFTLEQIIHHPLFISACVKSRSVQQAPEDFHLKPSHLYEIKTKAEMFKYHFGEGLYSYKYINIFGAECNSPEYTFLMFGNAGEITSTNPYPRKTTSRLVFEDGEPVFVGQQYHYIDKQDFKYNGTAIANYDTVVCPFYKYFRTKTDADKYIAENKPIYSAKQFVASCESEYKKGRADERRAYNAIDFAAAEKAFEENWKRYMK